MNVIVQAIMAGVARNGTRQMHAATAAAVVRVLLEHGRGDEVRDEVDMRMGLIKPVIEERGIAGAAGRSPRLAGSKRAKRNLAEHALFGQGVLALAAACRAPQRSQRDGSGPDGSGGATQDLEVRPDGMPFEPEASEDEPEREGGTGQEESCEAFYVGDGTDVGTQTDVIHICGDAEMAAARAAAA